MQQAAKELSGEAGMERQHKRIEFELDKLKLETLQAGFTRPSQLNPALAGSRVLAPSGALSSAYSTPEWKAARGSAAPSPFRPVTPHIVPDDGKRSSVVVNGTHVNPSPEWSDNEAVQKRYGEFEIFGTNIYPFVVGAADYIHHNQWSKKIDSAFGWLKPGRAYEAGRALRERFNEEMIKAGNFRRPERTIQPLRLNFSR